MTEPGRCALLFLDVDGPLIPFGGPGPYPTYGRADGNPLLARIDPAHGPRLAALPCEVVWATTWMDSANLCIAPLLGLPPLTVVDWPEPSEEEYAADENDGPYEPYGLHWKTRPLVTWAGGRPFAWVDDEITAVDRDWVAAHHPGPALLHRVDPRVGLTDGDYAVLDSWLRQPF
ncbi:hypothetical protein [Kitasatospora sp. NPDC057541]|uniref:hypothetical protein n=1 Tax=unclassified Kitasatospora TaxID=2633591 RepID=UPI0036A1FE87